MEFTKIIRGFFHSSGCKIFLAAESNRSRFQKDDQAHPESVLKILPHSSYHSPGSLLCSRLQDSRSHLSTQSHFCRP